MHIVPTHKDEDGDTRKSLDRNNWHDPLVSIIVTHHNYSDHIKDALLSLLDQTHGNWECVVVDDASDSGHRLALERIVSEIGCDRIRIVWKALNTGQIPAFFAGLDETRGEFVCLLDPDDRYAGSFLAEMLDAHLNEAVYCPIACSDQILMHKGKAVTGTYARFNMRYITKGEVPQAVPRTLVYTPREAKGWHWTSTSSMMFRRAALELMRPHKPLGYKGSADSYLAQGAHMLGGSLFLNHALVYRTAHDSNAWLSDAVFASTQSRGRVDGTGEERTAQCLIDVTEAIYLNGGGPHLAPKKRKKGLAARLAKSLKKRWGRYQASRITTAQA